MRKKLNFLIVSWSEKELYPLNNGKFSSKNGDKSSSFPW